MPQISHIHSQTEWLKTRLDEMDASVAHFESSLEKTSAMVQSRAANLMADMKRRRDSFKHWFDQREDQGEQAFGEAKDKLEHEWEAFETSVESFLETAENKADAANEAFKVRVTCQRKSWLHAIERAKTASHSFGEERKLEINKAIAKLEADANKLGYKLKGSNKAGHESWSAFRTALSDSRTAFDHAFGETKVAFNIAAKMNTGA